MPARRATTAYEAVYKEVARLNKEHGNGRRSARNGVPARVTDMACEAFGLAKVKLPPGPKPTYTEAHERYGDCVASTTGHVCALVGGVKAAANAWGAFGLAPKPNGQTQRLYPARLKLMWHR